MTRTRLLFEKTGRAQYISHLDLMRTFQRAFLRAGIRLRHTEGFNPHPYLSLALPLPVGMESLCELADFDLTDDLPPEALPERLNAKLPEGLRAVAAYVPASKISDIAWIDVGGRLVYDGGATAETADELTELFTAKELIVSKKSKKGPTEFDLIPRLRAIRFERTGETELAVRAVISAQNPATSPESIAAAVRAYRPSRSPDFAAFKRFEIFDDFQKIFR